MLVNRQPVSVASYEATRAVVLQADQQDGTKLTPFEVLTLIALQLFEQAAVDIVVMEVGMGGTWLDATNVIPTECILVSALTTVDLDHQGFLGNTVEAIATEKAGIARRGKPFVLGPQSGNNRDAVEKAVKSRVKEVGGRLCEPVKVEATGTEDAEFASGDTGNFRPPKGPTTQAFNAALSSTPIHAVLPLHGARQLDNLSTSLGIIQALLSLDDLRFDFRKVITLDTVERGIANVRWRGRLSWHKYPASGRQVPVLVDGATTLRPVGR
jgi:folylpolyglutamate synthase